MPGGALVSANYGNSAAVVGTPSGFAFLDLIRQMDLLDGATPNPVRGVATVPGQGVAYLTVPDSNLVITVPLPAQHSYAQATITITGSEQTVTFDPCLPYTFCPQTAPDAGTIWLTVDNAPTSTSYGSADTPTTIAANLASAINGMGYPVAAYANGGTLTLVAHDRGAGPNNWPIQVTCQSNYAQYGVGCSSFSFTTPATLSGGN